MCRGDVTNYILLHSCSLTIDCIFVIIYSSNRLTWLIITKIVQLSIFVDFLLNFFSNIIFFHAKFNGRQLPVLQRLSRILNYNLKWKGLLAFQIKTIEFVKLLLLLFFDTRIQLKPCVVCTISISPEIVPDKRFFIRWPVMQLLCMLLYIYK